MTLETIMTREVVTVAMDTTLREVRRLLAERGFHHVLVMEKQRHIVGVISDRDVLRHLSPFIETPSERSLDAASLNRHAHQVMSRHVIAGTPGMTPAAAAGLLIAHRISCLPVLDGEGRCVGIVTWRDLLRTAYPDAAAGAGRASATKTAA